VPIDARDVGTPAPFILQAGISSTTRIAQFWGLLDKAAARPKPAPIRIVPSPQQPALPEIEAAFVPPERIARPQVETIILRALKAAGLIRKR
jgi:hypothetical protein